MRLSLKIIFLFLFFASHSSAQQKWKSSSCGPHRGSVKNSFDCSVVASDPVAWCYESLEKPEQFNIKYIFVSQTSAECGYVHKWNRQGAINWTTNVGSDECPLGTIYDHKTFQCIDHQEDECVVGNPVKLITGEKIQTEIDLTLSAYGRSFDIKRYYNSSKAKISTNPKSTKPTWRFQYEDHLVYLPIYDGPPGDPNYLREAFILELSNGKKASFTKNDAGVFAPFIPARYGNLTPTLIDGEIASWEVSDKQSKVTYTFSRTGGLQKLIDSDGTTIDFIDSNSGFKTDISVNGKILFSYIRAHFGGATGKVTSVELPGGDSFIYEYDDNSNLKKVINPDTSFKQYLYRDLNYPQLLSAIVDEKGDEYAAWEYNNEGLAEVSVHAGGKERVDIDYTYYNDVKDPRVAYTNALNHVTTVHFDYFNGKRKPKKIVKAASQNTPEQITILDYDNNGFLDYRKDGMGNVTTYVRDEYGREKIRTEGLGALEQRIIATDWNNQSNKPHYITTSLNQEIYGYDAEGRILTRTLSSVDGVRTWTYTYNNLGQIETEDGPRTEAQDVTTYNYYPDGNLQTIVNAAGHTSTFSDYHYSGQPQTITDANNVVTKLSYSWRGKIKTSTLKHPSGDAAKDRVLTYKYDARGLIERITRTNGSYLEYEYDAAQNLRYIINSDNERIDFGYDNNGNITSRTIKNDIGLLVFSLTKVFNGLNHLVSMTSGEGISEQLNYHANYKLKTREDGRKNVTAYSYDSLNRIAKVVNADTAETQYGYDVQDRVKSVTDGRNLETIYRFNKQGDQKELDSPDSGVSISTPDEAGNRVKYTDARNVTSIYTYDALNRLETISYPASPTENVTYTYDQAENDNYGKGRLTKITDNSGEAHYKYNYLGLVSEKTSLIKGQRYVISYRYNSEANLIGITYPSGREIDTPLDTQYRPLQIATKYGSNATQKTVLDSAIYMPFGPLKGVKYRNGASITYGWDLDYKAKSIAVTGLTTILDRTYGYDASGNISSINDSVEPATNQTFFYDKVNRLNYASGNYGQLDYRYDKVGNRKKKDTTKAGSTVNTDYTYSELSNRLNNKSSIVAGQAANTTYTYDANGNTASELDHNHKPRLTYTYNSANRLSTVTKAGSTFQYTYNALGQRVEKIVNEATLHFHYDEKGRLMSVSDMVGAPKEDYIYFGDHLVEVVYYTGLAPVYTATHYAVVNDHLATPLMLLDDDQAIVWHAKTRTPFGDAGFDDDPDGDNTKVNFNIRFPGQYFDEEIGTVYNYYRTYDPSTGRYIQSDPIGLQGGLNTYAYVGGNPLIYTDPYGLEAMSAGAAWGLRGLGGVSLFVPVPGARVFGVGLIAMTIPGDTPQDMQMDGLADDPAPYDHFEEDEAL